MLPMRDEDAAPLLASLAEAERFATWHLVSGDGSIAGYGAGGADLLRTIRLTRPLGWLLALVPDRLADALYRLVAANRTRLGRLVPDGPAPRRFP